MRAYKPDMPLVAVFRDPLERLFSHWVMLRSRNLAWPDWPGFLTEWPPTSLPDEVPERRTHHALAAHDRRGARVLRRAAAARLRVFDRNQWLLLELRSMFGDFDETVDRTTDFLGLARLRARRRSQLVRRRRVRRHRSDRGRDRATRPTLYAADLALFDELSGLDTSPGPRPDPRRQLDPGELAASSARKVPLDR